MSASADLCGRTEAEWLRWQAECVRESASPCEPEALTFEYCAEVLEEWIARAEKAEARVKELEAEVELLVFMNVGAERLTNGAIPIADESGVDHGDR